MSQEQVSEENPHLLRLSLDIRTIKNAEFKGLIYAKYPGLSVLGTNLIFKTKLNYYISRNKTFQDITCY